MLLSEFRLESYEERSAIMGALEVMRARDPQYYPNEVGALLLRLSRTQCQPGGCEYCE